MSWSLTSLSTYEKCPLQYKFRYIDRIETTMQSGAASRGSELHGALEGFLTGKSETLPNEINFYTSLCKALKDQGAIAEHTIKLDRNWEPVAEGHWYKGVLDVKILHRATPDSDPHEATVIDWKTGKIYPEHDDQKSIYSLAVFAEEPSVQRVRARHIYLDLGKERERVFDRNEVHQLRTAWEHRVARLEGAQEFIPNPSYTCRFCPFSKGNSGPCRF